MVDPLKARRSAFGDEVEALLVLQEVPGVGLRRLHRLLRLAGSARAALSSPGLLDEVVGDAAAAAARDPKVRARASEAVRRAEAVGMDVVSFFDDGYPEVFRHLADPPPVLFLRGRAELLHRPGVGVVGARRSTWRARDVARRLAMAVARTGTPVVSGLALGVDGAAHLGALDADGPTVAVLGCGADVAYPASHRRLFHRVIQEGLVVSEFPPGTRAAPHHFPRRNRILAALSQTLVVVEAGLRSGALITVDHALDLGVDVWAVPGPIEEVSCAGSNRLLVDGARPLVSIDGFVAEVLGGGAGDGDGDADGEGGAAGAPAGPGRSEAADDAGGPEGDATVLRALARGTLTADDVVRSTGLSTARVLTVLAGLELQGRVTRLPGLRFRKAG